MTLKAVRSGWHWTFGYLRRPELDTDAQGYVYEAPGGALVRTRDPENQMCMHLTELIGSTGKRHIVPSRDGTYKRVASKIGGLNGKGS